MAVIQQEVKGPNTDGLLLVDQTVKYTNQIQMERRKLQEDKEELQNQLDAMRVAKDDQDDERRKFYEGASWLGRQALDVANKGVSKTEDLKLTYLQKLSDCGPDTFQRGRAAEWLLDSTIRITHQTKDENQKLVENAIRNMPK